MRQLEGDVQQECHSGLDVVVQGGADDHISIDGGQMLYDAAGEPKELWFEPTAMHHGLPEVAPQEYEQRVVGFFDQYLGGE